MSDHFLKIAAVERLTKQSVATSISLFLGWLRFFPATSRHLSTRVYPQTQPNPRGPAVGSGAHRHHVAGVKIRPRASLATSFSELLRAMCLAANLIPILNYRPLISLGSLAKPPSFSLMIKASLPYITPTLITSVLSRPFLNIRC